LEIPAKKEKHLLRVALPSNALHNVIFLQLAVLYSQGIGKHFSSEEPSLRGDRYSLLKKNCTVLRLLSPCGVLSARTT